MPDSEVSNIVVAAIDSVKWILLFIFLMIIKKPLFLLFSNKQVKFDIFGFKVETDQAAQQSIASTAKEKSILDNAMQTFRPETISKVQDRIFAETSVDKISTDHEKTEILMRYSTALYLILIFERLYESTYGSQIQMLTLINGRGKQDIAVIEHYYCQAKEKYPAAYENYSLEEYTRYLVSNNLIAIEAEIVNITHLGIDFLRFLADSGKDIYKAL